MTPPTRNQNSGDENRDDQRLSAEVLASGTPENVEAGTEAGNEATLRSRQDRIGLRTTSALTGLRTELIDQENPPKAVHGRYLTAVEQIEDNKAKADEELIRQASIKDLRRRSRLLNTKPETEESQIDQITNLKDETARRLRAYTSTRDDKWYTLNYEKFGSDSTGTSHEMGIGLGDILLDNDIEEVLIARQGKETIKGHKQIITNGPHKGRVGFADETGRYIATHTGDKFRILSDKETNIGNETEVQTYVTKLQEHETARETAKIETRRSNRDFYEPEGLPFKEESLIDQNQSVAEQLVMNLNQSQLEAAKIIEEEFKKAGLTEPNLIGAAIVNAFHESALNPAIIGTERNTQGVETGKSVGLFQLYDKGAGIRDGQLMTIEERQDPRINTQRIIELIRAKEGTSNLIARAEAGASVQELSKLFCMYIEVPRNPEVQGERRAYASLEFFPRKSVEVQDSLIAQYRTREGFTAHVKIKTGQETLVVGSSTAVGIGAVNTDSSIGSFGIGSASPKIVLRELNENILPRLGENFRLPKNIILLGMALNGGDTAENDLNTYLKIAKIFEEKGCEVRFSPLQLHEAQLAKVQEFNRLLTTDPKYSSYYIDTGINTPDTRLAEDGLHLAQPEYAKIFTAEKSLRTATA